MTIDSLLQNEIFSGLGAASLFGYMLYIARELPKKIWNVIIWRFTCSLTILNEDESYEKVNEWLSGLEYTKRCRRLRLTTQHNTDEQHGVDILTPGLGNHFFWYHGRPVFVERSFPEKTTISGGWRRLEDISIRTLGTNPKIIQEFVSEILEARQKTYFRSVNVFLYRKRWGSVCRKAKRSMDTIILPVSDKKNLVNDIENFIGARTWYQNHGVPYRRGYLLEGPPGCGKSSLIFALGAYLGRPIYSLNLGGISNDDELIDAVTEVPENGLLLIEDIDAAEASVKREFVTENTSSKECNKKISLSALLNVIDGVFSRDGRILFMTTNYPDKIDEALKRPGRADQIIHIGKLYKEEVLEMCNKFIPIKSDAQLFANNVKTPISPAELQEDLVQYVRGINEPS